MAREKIRLGGSIWNSRADYARHLLRMNFENPEYDKGEQPLLSKSTIAIRAGVTPQCVNWLYNTLLEKGEIGDYYTAFKEERKAKNAMKYQRSTGDAPRKRGRPPKVKVETSVATEESVAPVTTKTKKTYTATVKKIEDVKEARKTSWCHNELDMDNELASMAMEMESSASFDDLD